MTSEFSPSSAAAHREHIRQRFLAVDTSNVADVLDNLGFPDQGLSADFSPYPNSASRLAGWAYTIRGQMTPFPLGGDADKMTACQGVTPGEVTVWSGDGEGICYFGELIAIGMKERGCTGALVNGGIRDVKWIGEQQFPVYARYRTPIQSIGRWKVNAWQAPVVMPGATAKFVRINPGDFILADEDGAIAIPMDIVDQVLIAAEALTQTEGLIRGELLNGLSLADALKKYRHV